MTITPCEPRLDVRRAPLTRLLFAATSAAFGSFVLVACGDDDPGDGGESAAQRAGVGAACLADDDCDQKNAPLKCLSFKGGYCGLEDCQANSDCPEGSACVAHDDGMNYCFLVCSDKPECNITRPADSEANCSSSITFVEAGTNAKACVPPSG
jgi:hypothetical protein